MNPSALGAIMGSGGLVVMDETTCMVDVAKFFLNFTQLESCGKCPPCREGTKRMLEILQKICDGKGEMADIDTLELLCRVIKGSSLCALGQTAPNPIATTLRYFRNEYEAHIKDHRCPAGASTGEKKAGHVIDTSVCIKCGACFHKCKFDAILRA